MWKEFELLKFSDALVHSLFFRRLPEAVRVGTPADSIIKQLTAANCQFVLWEKNYIDSDYLNEYAALYSRVFRRHSPRCDRLHFFSGERPPQINNLDTAEHNPFYLGFCVLRPCETNWIGRTVLRANDYNSHDVFITCAAPFSSHINGEPFSTLAMPFIMQDTQVGACAQAALWMVARYMQKKFGTQQFFPAQISALAHSAEPLGRDYPASEKGLTAHQMLNALQRMGLGATLFSRSSSEWMTLGPDVSEIPGKEYFLPDMAYKYVESQLPVILNTSDHSVVAIGHTYNYDSGRTYPSAISRIPSLIVHDDEAGPYQRWSIQDCFLNADPAFRNKVTSIIVISPPSVTLNGRMAELQVQRYLSSFGDLEVSEETPDGKFLSEKVKGIQAVIKQSKSTFEYRTFLTKSTDLQMRFKHLSRGRNAVYSQEAAQQMSRMDLPKYVWITEISNAKQLGFRDTKDRKCSGMFLLDATSSNKAPRILGFHFLDIFAVNDLNGGGAPVVGYIENSTPFPHMTNTAPF